MNCTDKTTSPMSINSAKKDMDVLNLDESFLFRMIRMVNFFSESYENTVPPELKLSRREYHILLVIANHPGISAIEICELSGYSPMAVSRGVHNLLKYDRVVKKQDKTDKRKFNVALSKSGLELYRIISPVSRSLEQQAISGLSKKQIKLFDELLSILMSQRFSIDKTTYKIFGDLAD